MGEVARREQAELWLEGRSLPHTEGAVRGRSGSGGAAPRRHGHDLGVQMTADIGLVS